jgi:hypothetical protein
LLTTYKSHRERSAKFHEQSQKLELKWLPSD